MVMTRHEISLLGGAALSKKAKAAALDGYFKNPVYCKYCGNIIKPLITKGNRINIYLTKKKTFCNRSCAIRYKNPKPKTVITSHPCENPECKNLTTNSRFCCRKCCGRNTRLKKIDRFFAGKLNDNDIRDEPIRNILIERQGGGCEICGIPPIWNSRPIVFIVDHIDGNYENNLPENMRAICPNCNSQTLTFSGRNNFKVEHKIRRPKSNANRK